MYKIARKPYLFCRVLILPDLSVFSGYREGEEVTEELSIPASSMVNAEKASNGPLQNESSTSQLRSEPERSKCTDNPQKSQEPAGEFSVTEKYDFLCF